MDDDPNVSVLVDTMDATAQWPAWLAAAWALVGVGEPFAADEVEEQDEVDTGTADTGGDTDEPDEPDEPGEPEAACDGYLQQSSGSLSGQGATSWQPDGSWYQAAAGTHHGCLSGPESADFDLFLYRWTGWQWVAVAGSDARGSEETLSYTGGSGYYSWLVKSHSGSGAFDFGLTTP